MKTVRDVISRPSVWVNPEHSIESAIVLMRGFHLGGLPVVDSGGYVGMVEERDLLGADIKLSVAEVMSTGSPILSPDLTVREAASVLSRAGVDRAPVVEGDQLIGVLNVSDLLPELGRSVDPLTDFPWADALREWAIEQLESGAEITVLFIDLDRFGQFNKLYGHIIGDEVLKSVARALREASDPLLDLVCRYGGDEFCIASLRTADAANELANSICERVAAVEVPPLNERITCSIGLRGGKRTREREHTHYAATLNSLINLASQACTANKQAAPASAEAPVMAVTVRQEVSPRVRLSRIEVQWQAPTARVRVDIGLGPDDTAKFTASTSSDTDEDGVLRLVAETTVAALRGVLPTGHLISLTEVILNTLTSGQTLITAVGQLTAENRPTPIAGSAVVGDDPYRAAAAAVMSAVNRRLELILGGQPY